MKRVFDFLSAGLGLIVLSPILLIAMFLIWREDRHSPFYFGSRIGRGGRSFDMIKLRSMRINAEKSGVSSTSNDDDRITAVGHMVRRYKIDELPQLLNVVTGKMSLVGPRPNLQSAVDGYTEEEKKLISARPGITDLSSIVFSDEGRILEGSKDPDLSYEQLIRPWKSRLGLVYVENSSVLLDIKIIIATLVAILNKRTALAMVHTILKDLNADEELIKVAQRERKLVPTPPPGSNEIVRSLRF